MITLFIEWLSHPQILCFKKIGQSSRASRWRVCYQRGLPRLVLIGIQIFFWNMFHRYENMYILFLKPNNKHNIQEIDAKTCMWVCNLQKIYNKHATSFINQNAVERKCCLHKSVKKKNLQFYISNFLRDKTLLKFTFQLPYNMEEINLINIGTMQEKYLLRHRYQKIFETLNTNLMLLHEPHYISLWLNSSLQKAHTFSLAN